MAIPNQPGWAQLLLGRLGAPVTSENLRFLAAWQRAEGGGAANNPFNTTEPYAGATGYNSVGVKNYPTPGAGIDATTRTLMNGRYGNIVGLLRSGRASAQQLASAVAQSPWGTGSGVLRVLGSGPVSFGNIHPGHATPAAVPGFGPQFKQMAAQVFMNNAMRAVEGKQPDFSGLLQLAQQRQQFGAAQQAFGPKGAALGRSVVGVIHSALQQQGVPYVWGGTTPKGFDCSGLVQWAFAQHGVNIPRTSEQQWAAGRPVAQGQLRAGDVVFFRGSDGTPPGHEALYIGNGRVIVAPHTGSHVQIESLGSIGGYMGARRFA